MTARSPHRTRARALLCGGTLPEAVAAQLSVPLRRVRRWAREFGVGYVRAGGGYWLPADAPAATRAHFERKYRRSAAAGGAA